MSRTQTLVQLSKELVEALDRKAARLGLSRSKLIRDLLDEALRDDARRDKERQYVDGYCRMPQPESTDDWGDLDAWSREAGRRSLKAMAKDEEPSG